MKINDLKKELKMLIETEERLMRFLMQHPEHCKENLMVVKKVKNLFLEKRKKI